MSNPPNTNITSGNDNNMPTPSNLPSHPQIAPNNYYTKLTTRLTGHMTPQEESTFRTSLFERRLFQGIPDKSVCVRIAVLF